MRGCLKPHPSTLTTMASSTAPQLELARYKLETLSNGTTFTHTTVWRNDKILGSGNFGMVWRQIEERSGELRAVKVIPKSQSRTQELSTLATLRNVCHLHFVAQHQSLGTLYTTDKPVVSTSFRPIFRLVRRPKFNSYCDGIHPPRRSLSIYNSGSKEGESRGQGHHSSNPYRACGTSRARNLSSRFEAAGRH